jgi:phage terminase small subunit
VTAKPPRPPKHLSPPARVWWREAMERYVFEAHEVRQVTLAAEFWSRGEAARKEIELHGLTYLDKNDCPKERPEVRTARECAAMFCRIIRELRLDTPPPDDSRPPRLGPR